MLEAAPVQQPSYRPDDIVDFIVVGAGAAGGVVARELSRAGFRVVVLEQGPWLTERDFKHDEYGVGWRAALTNDYGVQPNTQRTTEREVATVAQAVKYGRMVGGGSAHFTGNFWRFRPIDFTEVSSKGPLAGSSLADWPITYDDLEPYYTKVDWEIGVSGAPGPNDPRRSRPYPMPPLPIKPTGALVEIGAKKLGWTSQVAPMAIASRPYRGRGACVNCGFCEQFGCEVRAKSSTLATMIPEAVATGTCEVRPNSYARKVEINRAGRVVGVKYFDRERREVFQRAKAVIVCANGAETPRLLLMSKSNLFPQGLANSHGVVGTNLMFNSGGAAWGLFEHEVNGFKGTVDSRIITDFYELDPKLGIAGGGALDMRFDAYPIGFATWAVPRDVPRWGKGFKRFLRDGFTRSAYSLAHSTSLPVPTNSISLDPTLKDAWGLPAIRMTFAEHENDHRLSAYFTERAKELVRAAGATKVWWDDPGPGLFPQVHLLGTCRMGNDPRTSVVDEHHRAHDVPGLFTVDGSSFVTSGRGQPTMTIQALAFRAAEGIASAAKAGRV